MNAGDKEEKKLLGKSWSSTSFLGERGYSTSKTDLQRQTILKNGFKVILFRKISYAASKTSNAQEKVSNESMNIGNAQEKVSNEFVPLLRNADIKERFIDNIRIGVCKVADIVNLSVNKKPPVQYYLLSSVFDKSKTCYVGRGANGYWVVEK